ncbi:DUF7340 domain-containing protein [Amycolatopsis kentuckyensis]|uniref:DUF7340 domain-containing protein n=1 Tax=Amycolatopsis kentuckyensis TaxID=218823 RepID=UPI00117883AC|nr:hypothetical protein [Amycolatopsis kentuckyensis]
MTGMLAGLHDDVRLAVAALVDPVTITLPREGGGWVQGTNDCLIDQLTEAIGVGLERGGGRRTGGPGLPICVAAVDLYAEAFDAFRAPGFTLKQSIAAIPDHLIGNEDVPSLSRGLQMLKKLRADIESLFAPVAKVALKGACPECGVSYVERVDELQETVKVPVLSVDAVNGASCRNCDMVWPTSLLETFAALLTGSD